MPIDSVSQLPLMGLGLDDIWFNPAPVRSVDCRKAAGCPAQSKPKFTARLIRQIRNWLT
jgi:hypothetical protein